MLADFYVESVLAKCEALKKGGIWAPEPHVRPGAWLDNFKDPQDRLLAAILLDNFVFYSERTAGRLLAAGYDQLEDEVLLGHIPSNGTPDTFLDGCIFTPIEGETPRPTDSGNTLCKKLRDLKEIDDSRFFETPDALREVLQGRSVVFVDDFLGSGQQMIRTWQRAYLGAAPSSFEEAHARHPFTAICLAMVATEKALESIARDVPAVRVVATHVLDASYSVQKLDAPMLTPPLIDFQRSLRSFLARHAPHLDLPPFLQAGAPSLFGFYELGLLFAIQGGVPDSTVPLLWAAGHGGWIRLVRKNA